MIFSKNRLPRIACGQVFPGHAQRADSALALKDRRFPREPADGGVWYNALQQNLDCNAQN
jgi:hypothetical protein